MAIPPTDNAPAPGFAAKLLAHGCKYYVNICSHPAIDRPMDAQDRPVGDEHLNALGVDNLRVPLLTGPARVIGDGAVETIAIDVVYNPACLRVCLPPEPRDDDGPLEKRMQLLGKTVRMRLVDLALKNVEEDLNVTLGRDYQLPRNLPYKGGVGPEKRPAPMAILRKMAAAKQAEAAHKELAAAPGPWRSSRSKVGLGAREAPRIVELGEEAAGGGGGGGGGGSAATGGGGGAKKGAAVKKGFLNSAKAQGALYPDGSTEGTPPEGAGDPLGWMPKGLRNKVQVVDPDMPAEQQRELMEKAAKGELRGPAPPKKAGAAGGGSAPGGDMGMKGGFLAGKGGALAAAADEAGAGSAPAGRARGPRQQELELLQQMMPSEDEVKRIAENTDPEAFLSDLGQMASNLGLNGAAATDEVHKLAEAFKLTDGLKPGQPVDAATMDKANELLEQSPFMKAKVEEVMRDPAAMRQLMEEQPEMRGMMQEAQHLLQQDPAWPELQAQFHAAQQDPARREKMRAEMQQSVDEQKDPAKRAQLQQELDRMQQLVPAADAAPPADKPRADKPRADKPPADEPPASAAAPAVAAPCVPAPAAAEAADASAGERTPEHSFADAEGGGLVLRVALPALSSMAAVELDVSSDALALHVPKLYRLRLPWPRPVDADAAKAKFLKKSGVLQIAVPAAAGVVV